MDPIQEHLVDLMVAATKLPREEVIKKWFATGTFKSIINCGFAERAAERARQRQKEH